MVYSFCQLEQSRVLARDGSVGWVRDMYFDHAAWTVRTLLVDTRGWLAGSKALISTHHVSQIDPGSRVIQLDWTKSQVERPHADIAAENVCGATEMLGYRVTGPNGELGEVSDLLFDPQNWGITCLLIEIEVDGDGGHVAIGSFNIVEVDRSERLLRADLASMDSVVPLRPEPAPPSVRDGRRDH